jgi:hypothetical protein
MPDDLDTGLFRRQVFGNRLAAIRGVIVDDDHFQAKGFILNGEHPPQTGRKRSGLIVTGHHNAEQGQGRTC